MEKAPKDPEVPPVKVEQSVGCGSEFCRIFKQHGLILSTLLGAVLGTGFGFGIREAHPSATALTWIGLPGELYMRMLKMMVVPLVIASVVSGTTFLDPKSNGKVSLVGVIYIAATNCLGAIIGVAGGLIGKPGQGENIFEKEEGGTKVELETQDIFVDLIRNLFPDNLFEASFSKAQTMYRQSEKNVTRNTDNGTVSELIIVMTKYVGQAGGTNLLGLIVACALFGMGAASIKEKGRSLLNFFVSVYDTAIVIVGWLMWFTPIGVFSIIGVAIAKIDDVEKIFRQLGMFALTVVVSLTAQQLVLFPLILLLILRKNPLKIYRSMGKSWMIAFASASMAVSMPEMIIACEIRQKMTKSITRVILPLCLALSANGSAVFIACASIFASNISGVPPSPADVVQIGLLTTIASMAIPAVPSASIVTIIMILTSLDIPADAVALLLAIEWFLDRCRTTSNVLSACFTVAITDKICHSVTHIETLDEDHNKVADDDTKQRCTDMELNGNVYIDKKNPIDIEHNGNVYIDKKMTDDDSEALQNARL